MAVIPGPTGTRPLSDRESRGRDEQGSPSSPPVATLAKLERLRRSIALLSPGQPAGLDREDAMAVLAELKAARAPGGWSAPAAGSREVGLLRRSGQRDGALQALRLVAVEEHEFHLR